MRLNIIGNGFDLYHGLPCSYYYFGCFLARHYPEFFDEMSEMFGFSCYRSIGYEEFETYVDKMFWSTFEMRLGELDSLWMENSLMDDLGLECDDPIDIDIPESNNAERIKKKFSEWIKTTVDTEENYQIIKDKIKEKRFKFNKEDFFVNFNYTQTLQKLYDIPDTQVYHIHGQAVMDECLIVGHGNDEEIRRLSLQIEEIESETYYLADQGVRNRLNEYECERFILEDLRKDVESCINEMNYILKGIKQEVDEIRIWGLSCGDVDTPYIDFLRKKYPNVKWAFSYFDAKEKETRIKYVDEIGLNKLRVDYFKLNNPDSEDILKEIVSDNGIIEF